MKTVMGYVPLREERSWSQRWYNCCGKCDGSGWAVCCLTHFLPCVIFGWNRERGLAASAFVWTLLYCLMGISGYMLYRLWTFTFVESSLESGVFLRLATCVDEGKLMCTAGGFSLILLAVILGYFVCTMGITAIGWCNRSDLRHKYSLPGNHCTDCLLWTFCRSCALCQEARTLIDNNVFEGTWMGPGSLAVTHWSFYPQENTVHYGVAAVPNEGRDAMDLETAHKPL